MASESLMNAAGRPSTHPFADLRSASYAHRRTKKYPRKTSRNTRSRCYLCRRHLLRRSRYEDARHHIESKAWAEDWDAERCHQFDVQNMDAITAYHRHGKHADIFEGRTGAMQDGWRVSGEDFGAWGRRRIGEMRAVKEERIRVQLAGCNDNENRHSSVTTASSTTTTLPTNSLDIHAHSLLAEILTPTKYLIRSCRARNIPVFPRIDSFAWFGEYAWQWHRNKSGCWEIGYANKCGGCSIPCSCCYVGNGSMYWPCACAEFERGERSPEESGRCALVEWVRGEGWEELMRKESEMEDGESESGSQDVGWEVVSEADAASEGWSVVSEESAFEIFDV